jgi:hypothetical protein
MNKELEKVVALYIESLQLNKDILKLISCARMDVLFGPYQKGEEFDGFTYPGLDDSLETIENSLKDVKGIYVSENFVEWSTEELEENYYTITREEILSTILGKELFSYL